MDFEKVDCHSFEWDSVLIGQRVLRLMLLSCLIRFPSSFSFSLWMLDALFCWLIDAYLFHWLQLPLGRRKLPSWSHVYERSLCSSNWVDVVERKVQIASATLRSSLSARPSKIHFTISLLLVYLHSWYIYTEAQETYGHIQSSDFTSTFCDSFSPQRIKDFMIETAPPL